ncbi:SDR family NAD(P)-dependent oxidoreductase [Aestuariimicrobium ganziense]|uniref:SDR family NAD(P)-dependent oxidoreductase n=1 Tax=Aestuariimicrobium ganziense TaxID=2773677 RepID=UPI0019426947|nr:SDR family NAD(P)-dependent oxidoreductase [Aestuariimicrobium ganziense]
MAQRVWLITGAGRGMGVHFVRAALEAGDAVVATGRNPETVTSALREALGVDHENLLITKLDVTQPADAEATVAAAKQRFGRVDVLVNNAANFYGGYFEEFTPEQIDHQLQTALVGPMNVTRAVLPVMREQRSGHVLSISSGAGLMGFEFNTAYSAAKFGMEGWMEALAPEVEPFGIHTTIVNPGFFRTELLTQDSASYSTPSIPDYAERHAAQVANYESMNGHQEGDPAKLARALVTIVNEPTPPQRFIALAAIVEVAEQKAHTLLAQADAYRELSSSLAHDDV